jgi:CRP/FNR family cyclic AMP-dependent transcriptional regulator
MEDTGIEIGALERIPFFAGLKPEELEQIAGIGQRTSIEAGRSIVERGDPGDSMYIVLSGMAQVDVGGRFHDLKPGDFFGEMAVIAGKKRMATVKAAESVEALRIPADAFQAFLLEHPRVAVSMLRSLVERLREVQERIDSWAGAW